MKKTILATLTVLLTAATAYAQGGPPGPPPGGPRAEFGPGRGLGLGMRHGKLITGAPYSADMSNVSVQTLSDGNTIQHTTTGHVARDSQGRTYEQVTVTGGPLGQNGAVTMTFITDPVAGYSYALNSNTKIAMRHVLRTPPAGPHSPDGSGGPGGNRSPTANRVESDLGTENLNGLNIQGKSVTHTIPAGTMGNVQPIVSTSETWYSPDLQIPISAKNNDPRFGQTTYALTNIQRGEPAASLFQIPSDYTIKDAPDRGPRGGGPM